MRELHIDDLTEDQVRAFLKAIAEAQGLTFRIDNGELRLCAPVKVHEDAKKFVGGLK